MTITVGVGGIGLLGPGLASWVEAAALLAAPSAWSPVATVVPPPTRLPANERRRAGLLIKASIGVADQAVTAAEAEVATLETVFASATSDTANCHALCEVLATADRLVSPTRFTNSVHNAAAGYWHIATQSRAASTTVAAHDGSFAAALLEAGAACAARQRAQLLVVADVPFPEPLHALRPLPDLFAVALVLVPPGAPARLGRLTIEPAAEAAETTSTAVGLEALRRAVPAARSLPLLEAMAAGRAASIVLPAWPGLGLRTQWSPAAGER